jgi:16S rRNA (uracil1498-N3)-methyltransferase
MHRFYLPPSACQDSTLTLSERDAHHAVEVLRLRRGERVVVLDGAGREFLCEVRAVERRAVTLAVTQQNPIPPLPYQVTLLQAVPKGKTMDLIVEKATELGAHRIVPILSERTVAQVPAEAAAAKLEKWQTTAIEAIKQCGSAWLPRVEAPLTPAAFLARGERFDLQFIASLQPDGRHPREHFQNFVAERQALPKCLALWIGPEGDFTPAELNTIKAAGAMPITLGPLVLRSETAAIYALAVVSYELQGGA